MTEDTETLEAQPVLELPLGDWHRNRGARMVSFAGYSMPIQYEGIIAEHLWTRSAAGLFDVSHMGQLLLSGEGLDVALEALLPTDLSTLSLGQQRYSVLLGENGGILDDLMIQRWPGHIYMVVNGATKWDDIGVLREQLADEITLNHLEDQALLALQGPKAADVLARHAEGEYPLSSLSFMRFAAYTLAGAPATISRSGYTGEDGFEISIPADAAVRVADLLCGEPEVKPIGLGARDSLRLEAGLPLYGHDLDDGVDPVEADLAFAVSKRRRSEGGFPGSARILGALANGPARRRVGFAIEGRMPAREGAPLYFGAESVGTVTSGGFSPSLEQPIGMALVKAEHSAIGTVLEAEVRGRRLRATLCPMPFLPHRYHRKGASK